MNPQNPFKWRHFEAEIILLCVRWYLRYALSYRDLEEMMRERGLQMDHTTIYRWVQHYAPELEKRSRPHLKVILARMTYLRHERWKAERHPGGINTSSVSPLPLSCHRFLVATFKANGSQ